MTTTATTSKTICQDRFGEILKAGDSISVTNYVTMQCKLYEKKDGNLYFKPEGHKEEKLSTFQSDDVIKLFVNLKK